MFKFKRKEYTDLQIAFLEALRDPINKGDLKVCKEVAGYPATTPVAVIVKALKDEILDLAKEILANNSVKASLAIVEGIDNVDPNTKERTANAERILDRVGIVKGEKVTVEDGTPKIALLPRRKSE